MKNSRYAMSALSTLVYLLLAFPGIASALLLTLAVSLYQGELVINPLALFLVAVLIVNFAVPRPFRKILKSIPKKWRTVLWEFWKMTETKKALRVSGSSQIRASLRTTAKSRSLKKD